MEISKDFISSKSVRDHALILAKRIYDDNFIPDVIYVSLRGGAVIGNVISEFFKVLNVKDHPIFYAAVVARSYTDIRHRGRICVDGWTYNPEHLRHGDKVLFVDDIFDSGRTINYLVDVILNKGILRQDIRVVVHDYKVGSDKETLPIIPDYWWKKYHSDENKQWIHYLGHELEGLTVSEIREHYLSISPELADVFDLIKLKQAKNKIHS